MISLQPRKISRVASATQNGKTESFLWDGLALIQRNEVSYVNEPYVTGGNPLLSSKGDVMFNDMLGSTLGVNNETGFNPVKMTAFGETEDKNAFFTGKPAIGELGYAFLFRNYRADQGKWNSQDPIALLIAQGHKHSMLPVEYELGYPDGWNNLAYINNKAANAFDPLGLTAIGDSFESDGIRYTFQGWDAVQTYTFVTGRSGAQYLTEDYYTVYRAQWDWVCIKADCTEIGDSGTVYSSGMCGGPVMDSPLVSRVGITVLQLSSLPSPSGGTIPVDTIGVTPLSGVGNQPPAGTTAPSPVPAGHVHE